jgi:prepilin-type N-terminal cleavage/methylation domain-containing protein
MSNPPAPRFRKRGRGRFERIFLEQESGFSLVELMITMIVFSLAIVASASVFSGLLTQFKQQSKITETNIEGIIGLELLRRDIAHAGYGLPWDLDVATYQEAGVEGATPWVDRDFNDGPPNNPTRGTELTGNSNPPGAVRSGNNAAGSLNGGSDVIVIKSVNVARNNASSRWTHLSSVNAVTEWTPATERLVTNDRVIVINPGDNERTLVVDTVANTFFTTYQAGTNPDSVSDPNGEFVPLNAIQTNVVYGIAPAGALRMPFNRADFYVRIPASNFPLRCANGTGILYKGTVNHADGLLTETPLLDCVANMQAVYRLDTDANGAIDASTNDINALTAEQIRAQLKEVRVFVLAHEGQRDPNYTFGNFTGALANTIRVGMSAALGRDVNISGITDFLRYRWKVYTLVVKTNQLAGS